MKNKMILTALTISSFVGGSAQINSPDGQGFLQRGIAMYNDQNYTGSIDQLKQAAAMIPEGVSHEEIDRLIAMSEFKMHHYDRAITLLRDFLDKYSESTWRSDVKMAIGDCLFEENFALALQQYKEVDWRALVGERQEEYFYKRGYCEMKLADFENALHDFQRLEGSKKYGNGAMFYRGYIAYCRQDYDLALARFSRVNKSVAPGTMTDYYVSEIYYNTGDYSKALTSARAALRENYVDKKFTAEANRVAGESLYRLGRTSEAIPHIKAYVNNTDEPLPSSLYILGLSQYQEGEYSDAVASLRRVTGEDSSMGQNAYLYIGHSLLKLGDNDGAILAFDRASKMTYDDAARENAYYNYAVAKYQGGNVPFGSSVATFEDYLRLYPNSAHADDVRQYIVAGYVTDQNYESALAAINRAENPSAKLLAAKQQVLYQLGSRELASGDNVKALQHLVEAKELARYNDDTARETSLVLGEAYYRTGDMTNAASELLEYIGSDSTDSHNRAVALYDLGYVRMEQKEWSKAETNFTRMVSSPADLTSQVQADAWNRIGDCRYYQKEWSSAADAYAKAYQTAPRSGDYSLYQEALMKGYSGDYAEKYKLLTKLENEFKTSSLIPDALLEKSESQINMGQSDKAIETYDQLISEYGTTAQGRQAYLQKAMTQTSNGDRTQAMSTYRELIKKYPTSDESKQAIETLKRMNADDGTLDEFLSFMNTVDNAPAVDPAETERLKFNSAEQAYLGGAGVKRLQDYVKTYPNGSYTLSALNYIMDYAAENDNDDMAYEAASAIVSRYPDNAAAEDALEVKAEIEADRGQGELALKSWKALEQRASSSATQNSARMGIMRVARDLGQADDLLAAADAVLASSTIGAEEQTEAAFSRGLALEMKGDNDSARDIWSHLAQQTDDLYGAKAAVYLANNLYDNNELSRAQKVTETFVNSGTPHTYWLARGFILLSDITRAKGQNYEADDYLKALRDNYPGDETDIFEMIDSRLAK
jgi:TolA-binding protein